MPEQLLDPVLALAAWARPRSLRASSTLPATVSHGNSADSWNIRRGAAVDVDRAGASGWSSPATRLSSVLLAAAGGADEADELARRDVEVDAVEGGTAARPLP